MRNPRARLQHNAGDSAYRHMRAHAGFVHQHESAIQNIKLAVLKEDHRRAIFERDRV